MAIVTSASAKLRFTDVSSFEDITLKILGVISTSDLLAAYTLVDTFAECG